MPSKYQIISELAAQKALEITSAPETYRSFLATAANNYKYDFREQLLIYAQKPDATACAQIEVWNRLGRWVNKGTKGIALLVEDGSQYRLRHVFDVTDTNSRNKSYVNLWRMRETDIPQVEEALRNSFGDFGQQPNFAGSVVAATTIVVDDNLTDYMEQLTSVRSGEADIQEDTITGFRDMLRVSVSYMVLARSGMEPDRVFTPEVFRGILAYQSPEAISILGQAASDMAEMILREIERTVKALERENPGRTFANQSPVHHNEGEINDERSTDYGTDLQTGGGLPAAEPDRPGEPEDWEVWNAAARVPPEPQERDLHRDDAQREAEQPSGGDRPDGLRADGDTDHADGQDRGRDGSPEGIGSDVVGPEDEPHPEPGGGAGPDGADLQLTDPGLSDAPDSLPSSNHDFDARSDIPYYYHDGEKNELLRSSSALKNHRIEIAAFFADHENRQERGDFIRSFYDSTPVEMELSDGQRAGYRAYEDLLMLWRGGYDAREMEEYVRWPSIADHIHGMILLEQWLDPEERPLPSEGEQIALIEEAQAEKGFVLPQAAIDYVLCGGSGVSQGKLRIYEQFQKHEDSRENIRFLKQEYGVGGHSDAIPGSGFWEDHDGKGITIRQGISADGNHPSVTLTWTRVEKRIGELIAADRYLNAAEKAAYPSYLRGKEIRAERNRIADEFMEIVGGYKDYVRDTGREDPLTDHWYLVSCAGAFRTEDKKMFARTGDGDFILPMMREAMEAVIRDENSPFRERAEAVLIELSGPLAMPLEPTEEELNPPPEPEKEYRLNAGDTVYLGAREYEIVFLGEEKVVLRDPTFPILTEDITREEFDRKVTESPYNDKYLHVIEAPVPTETEVSEEPADAPELIPGETVIELDGRTFLVDSVDPDSGTVSLRDQTFAGSVGFPIFRTEPIDRIREIIALQKESEDEPEQQPDSLAQDAGESRVDEMLRQAELAYQLSEETGQNVFAFEKGNPEPVNVPKEIPEPVTVASYPGEDTGLPYDIVVQTIPTEPEQILPPPEPIPKSRVTPTMLHPEIPADRRFDFRIENDDLGVGTPLDRFHRNIRAIQLLKKLEDEQRLATPTEQGVLSEYVGWGGLPQFFEETNPHYGELKDLLTEEEYASARESTLTAFYTPPVVIRAMYQALENMGFQSGNLLEPSCGIGNFIGMKPERLADSRIYGVELDSISGRIAQQLYQNSSIAIQGFENTDLPDSFFDVAIGNIPFGSFKVNDRQYNKYNFLIHDYFFAKTLDKVRPSGIVAFVTSKGTMDKETSNVRRYIAQRADLLGAIRLPNNTFKSAAGTEVTSDILFLQKRDRIIDLEPDWVHLGADENGLRMNQYFIDNPDMVLGEMREVSGPFGPDTACIAYEDRDLGELLSEAIGNIAGSITEYDFDTLADEEEDLSIPADPNVRNFSYTLVDGALYYRENSRMNPVEVSVTGANRIKGMIEIRDCVRKLIEYQTEDYPDQMIAQAQAELNERYDAFTAKYGIINCRANKSIFNTDSSYFLLSSLEILDDDGNFSRKADMFTKRTIRQRVEVTHVDTASEALAVSLGERAKVDMAFMSELTGKTEQEVFADLKGIVFLNPLYGFGNDSAEKYLTADEYLSGNVREKLAKARQSAELYPDDYAPNVEALEAVQPVDLTAAEISVRLGATWLPVDVVEDFMFELFSTPWYCQRNIKVHYSQYTGEWNIAGKTYDRGNVRANSTYGTDRINGYKIIEQTLNLKDVRIFDYIENDEGKKVAVLNKKETAIAQGKQDQIKQAFLDWVWKDIGRRDRLCKLYNEKFNSIRPREYDGSHLVLSGINPEIELRPHQLNAVARGLYGGNELLGHVVGAGKTYTMVAIAQESKRLGLCQKSMFVVPNHLTEQWAAEYLQLYPAANILVATARDFEMKNRKRFCGRIATGDFDAVIIGHSQLEKIPMSYERQRQVLEKEKFEILKGIAEIRENNGDRFSVKQLEKSKKAIETKLERLNDQSRKDDLVTFEELGVDRLFIDEAHFYKNLAAYTKMRNVAGISQTEAQKSSDLYMKCRYLDEITGGRGIVFATGTPISNTMVEMFTMQKYLQYSTLERNALLHFDAWASTFGETVTAIELAPEGSGYRAKTRFAKFYNLPELMAMFKEVADIQTSDMLNLPVPKANYHTVALKPSEFQKEMVAELSERAEKVRNGSVDSSVDNMLVITNDGRKLALDQRLMNPMLPDSETGKVQTCAENVYEIWERTAKQRCAQMVFCDRAAIRCCV